MCTQLKLPLNSYDPNITKPGLKLNTSYLIQNHIAYNTAVASLNKKQLNKHGLGKAGGGGDLNLLVQVINLPPSISIQ